MGDQETKDVKISGSDAAATETPVGDVIYSKTYERRQKAEVRLTSASRRLASAVLFGIESWEKERDKSSRKKKDGAMLDAPENLAKAYGEALRQASRAPEDLVKGVRVYMPKKVQKFFGLS
jgi:hypothetical protein